MDNGKKSGARYVEAGDSDNGQRIDNFLLKTLKGVPKSHVYRTIRTGQIRINGRRCRAHYKLALGDRIRIPPLRRPSPKRPIPGFTEPVPVLYEDNFLAVYDKPSGLAVHGGSGISAGLIERARAEAGSAGAEFQLVHRLDRDTSGIVMVAKRRKILRELHALFREGKISKKYSALVKGKWERKHEALTASLSKWGTRKGERVVDVDDEGQSAVTRTRCLEQWKDMAKLDVKLVTGRTHQIRVHLAHAGLPVVGDDKYGDFAFNRLAKRWGLSRLMLHAREISFTHPETGDRVSFSSPLPGEFALFEERANSREETD